jgi:polysaccharide pyruvyl transferase WcaK-like protein
MRYAVIGAALSGNKGAAAMLESTVQHLSESDPAAHFDVLTVYPRSDAALNEHPNVSILDASPLRLGVVINGASLAHRVLPPLRDRIEKSVPEVGAIAEADVLLDEGGITFVDGRGKFLIYNVATILPPLLLRTPVVKVAQAMGPFQEWANGTAARALLPKVRKIVARGDQTFGFLRELGLDNVVRGADAAFTLDVGEAAVQTARARVDTSFFDSEDVIGFCPSAVLQKSATKAGDDYVEDSARIINHITDDLGLPVLLLAHSARTGTEKTHNNDLPVCREIHSRLTSPEKVLFVDQELGPKELRYLISRCRVLVAARFHAMVSALSTGVPTVVIGWSHKYGEVLEDFGLNDYALSLADASAHNVDALIDRSLENHETISSQIRRRYQDVRQAAASQFDIIREIASGREPSAKRKSTRYPRWDGQNLTATLVK